MSAQIVIDTFDFVSNNRTLHGKIILNECVRLKDYLYDNQGELKYKISGFLDKNDKSVLQITINGEISLHCQRCLGELIHLLDVQRDILLAENENELSHLDEIETIDGILAVSNLDVLELIEDEIILSLPISPRHRENECSAQELIDSNTTGEKNSFAALAKLKKHTKII